MDKQLLAATFYGNTIKAWIIALLVALLSLAVLILLKTVVRRKVKSYVERTAADVSNLAAALYGRVRFFFLLMFAVFLGSHFLSLPDSVKAVIDKLMVVALLFQASILGSGFLDYWRERWIRRKKEEDPDSARTYKALGFLFRAALWSIVLLLTLNYLGINITALVAGLGVGGVAVALAVQYILSDFIAAMSMRVDKPFVKGDFIGVGNVLGTVERIGYKSTRVRSLNGEQIIFPNTDLDKSRIQNFNRMPERRRVFSISVVYETPPEKLEAIPGMIRGIIEKQPLARFDRSHLSEFGSLAIVFENVYFVASSDYNTYMDIQHTIYLEVVRRFLKEGIKLSSWKPFPDKPTRN